jgi:hypothetical protein
MDEHRHVALPKLYGAPAYARPPIVAENPVPRPVDLDDLPLVAETSADEPEDLDVPAMPPSEVTLPDPPLDESLIDAPPVDALQPRPFSIRELAERLRAPRL